MRGYIEVLAIPQWVCPARAPRVEEGASVAPGLGCDIKSVDAIAFDRRIIQTAPPYTVVEPQLALGLIPGRGGRAGSCREREIAIAGVDGLGLRLDEREQRRHCRAKQQRTSLFKHLFLHLSNRLPLRSEIPASGLVGFHRLEISPLVLNLCV